MSLVFVVLFDHLCIYFFPCCFWVRLTYTQLQSCFYSHTSNSSWLIQYAICAVCSGHCGQTWFSLRTWKIWFFCFLFPMVLLAPSTVLFVAGNCSSSVLFILTCPVHQGIIIQPVFGFHSVTKEGFIGGNSERRFWNAKNWMCECLEVICFEIKSFRCSSPIRTTYYWIRPAQMPTKA